MEIETVTASERLGGGTEIVARRRPHQRYYWRRMEGIIGASQGKETNLIYVEYGASGNVHGRPITEAELKRKGAKP